MAEVVESSARGSRTIGMRRMFSGLAVVGVVVEEPLWIDGAYRAAVLRADETGIEGPAGTGLAVR